MIASCIFIPQGRNTFSFETYLRVSLCARFYRICHFTVDGIDHDLAAQCCNRKRYRNCRVNIAVLSLEDRMTLYHNLNEQISSRSAICTRLSLFADPDALSVINTGRNGYLDLLAG